MPHHWAGTHMSTWHEAATTHILLTVDKVGQGTSNHYIYKVAYSTICEYKSETMSGIYIYIYPNLLFVGFGMSSMYIYIYTHRGTHKLEDMSFCGIVCSDPCRILKAYGNHPEQSWSNEDQWGNVYTMFNAPLTRSAVFFVERDASPNVPVDCGTSRSDTNACGFFHTLLFHTLCRIKISEINFCKLHLNMRPRPKQKWQINYIDKIWWHESIFGIYHIYIYIFQKKCIYMHYHVYIHMSWVSVASSHKPTTTYCRIQIANLQEFIFWNQRKIFSEV